MTSKLIQNNSNITSNVYENFVLFFINFKHYEIVCICYLLNIKEK